MLKQESKNQMSVFHSRFIDTNKQYRKENIVTMSSQQIAINMEKVQTQETENYV